MDNYKQSVIIAGTPKDVFAAIATQVQQWWGNTDTPVFAVNDEFTTSFGNTYWKFKITAFIPGEKIYWECIEAVHIHEGYENIEREWVGTTAKWELESQGHLTKVSFEHDGLTEALNCYEVCEPAWDRFITSSLKQFVETGKEMPHIS